MVAYTDYRFDARVQREAETLAAAGFRVVCVTPDDPEESKRQTRGGVEVRVLPVRKYQGKSPVRYMLSYSRFVLAAGWACIRMLARERLDAVHIHNLPDFLVLSALVPRLLGRKVVLDVHDSVPETFVTKFPGSSRWWFKLLCSEERLSAALAHRVICVNHPQRELLVRRRIPAAKTFVSMNVPDHRIFTDGKTKRGPAGSGFRIVYHGTMARRLGVDFIIRAAKRAQAQIPGLEVHLWGPGDDYESFARLARELGLNGVVDFRPAGFPLPELPGRLIPMDVGVVANRRNAATELMLPVKLMEYVALGIPVVAPRLKTIEHYFTPEMVSFFEPEDIEELAARMIELYRSPDQGLRQATAARRFLDEFGWERQGPELVGFYRDLLGR